MTLRGRIVSEAMTWIGTPYRREHRAVKGPTGGCDCASLLAGVAIGAGILRPDYVLAPYSSDRHLHRMDEAYRARMLGAGFAAIDIDNAALGDVLLFVVGDRQPASHAGIVVEMHGGRAERIVHAYLTLRQVATRRIDERWRRQIRFAFRFPGVV